MGSMIIGTGCVTKMMIFSSWKWTAELVFEELMQLAALMDDVHIADLQQS